MSRVRVVLTAGVIVAAAMGAILAATDAREQKQRTREYADRIEQLVFRAGVIQADMEASAKAGTGTLSELEGDLATLARSLTATARELAAMMERSQEMLQNREAISDAEIEQDLLGVRFQLDNAAKSLENSMQYMEHLTYKVHKLSS